MQTSLVYLFFFCLFMAALTFYIGFIRPPKVMAWLAQAAFLMWMFLLTPVLGYVLYQQSGAIDRLESTGFKAHPAIIESVGIANGLGAEPTWLFKIEDDLMEIMDFYRLAESHPGWEMLGESKTVLTFERGSERMTLAGRKGWSDSSLMFSMSKSQNVERRMQHSE